MFVGLLGGLVEEEALAFAGVVLGEALVGVLVAGFMAAVEGGVEGVVEGLDAGVVPVAEPIEAPSEELVVPDVVVVVVFGEKAPSPAGFASLSLAFMSASPLVGWPSRRAGGGGVGGGKFGRDPPCMLAF